MGATKGARVGNPPRKKHTWQTVEWHAGDVTSPAKESSVIVGFERFNSEAGKKAARRNVVANGVSDVDPAHGSHTAVIKAAKSA